jgi:hypothetical protein
MVRQKISKKIEKILPRFYIKDTFTRAIIVAKMLVKPSKAALTLAPWATRQKQDKSCLLLRRQGADGSTDLAAFLSTTVRC